MVAMNKINITHLVFFARHRWKHFLFFYFFLGIKEKNLYFFWKPGQPPGKKYQHPGIEMMWSKMYLLYMQLQFLLYVHIWKKKSKTLDNKGISNMLWFDTKLLNIHIDKLQNCVHTCDHVEVLLHICMIVNCKCTKNWIVKMYYDCN